MNSTEDILAILARFGVGPFGLCMVATTAAAPDINLELNSRYNDEGDTLSVALASVYAPTLQTHLAANYSSAPIKHVEQTIDLFWTKPDAHVLIAQPSIGATRRTTALLMVSESRVTLYKNKDLNTFEFFKGELGLVPVQNEEQGANTNMQRETFLQVILDLKIRVEQANDLEPEERRDILGYLSAAQEILSQNTPDHEALKGILQGLIDRTKKFASRIGERIITSQIIDRITDAFPWLF